MSLRHKLRPLFLHRLLSTTSTLNLKPSPQTSQEKTRTALSLLRFEKNPDRILEICRAAALTPDSHLDRIAHAKAIANLKESRNDDLIRSFIKESMNRPESRSERAVSHFIVLYGQAGLVKDACKLFDEMPERNDKTLNSLLYSCLMAEAYDEMKRVFTEFPRRYKLELNLESYNIVLKGFCDSGSANSTYSILAEMERKGIKPNGTTFATAIAGFYKEEKFSDVGKMTELMKRNGTKQGIGIYNVRIQALCKLKRLSEAKALLDCLLSQGTKPNCVTYGHLIYGFCKEGKLDTAKSLYKEMLSCGLEPEAECYFALAYYLSRGGDFDEALRICNAGMVRGWYPNFTTMKMMVEGLASIGKVEEAKKIIGVVKGKFSRNADKWREIEEGLLTAE